MLLPPQANNGMARKLGHNRHPGVSSGTAAGSGIRIQQVFSNPSSDGTTEETVMALLKELQEKWEESSIPNHHR